MGLTLTKVSETATRITLGWTPVPGVIGYRFQSSTQAPKWSHTWDPTRSQVTFSKAEWYKVEALGVEAAGAYPVTEPPPPPPPPPPPTSYPASFFTGPLGASNIVPRDPNGALLMSWSFVTGDSEAQQRALLERRMTDIGRPFDGIQYQEGGLDSGGVRAEDWINSVGAVPLFTWNTFSSPASILSGADNGKIDALINRFKSKPYRVMVRLMHEFDLGHLPYYPHGGAAQWVDAWRHIANRVKAGSDNIGLWWCPTEQAGAPSRPLINACYPGDEYVDWVGSDTYNNVGGWSTPLHDGWAEPDELVNYNRLGGPASLCSQFGSRKPFMVGETGSRADGSNASRKANWHRNWDAARTGSNLLGVAFFDADTGSNEYNNWLVDHAQTYQQYQAHNRGTFSAETYQGYKDLASIPRWRVGVA